MREILRQHGIEIVETDQISELRNQIKTAIYRNSDEGYVSYKGCLRVCAKMMSILQLVRVSINPKRAFDTYIMILLEAVKLFFHADVSSEAATEVVRECLTGIDKLCKAADEDNKKHFFDTIIKSAKIKAFIDWPDYGYKLLRYAVYFVHNREQAQRIYEVISILGPMYDGKDYSDKLLITHSIIERIEGKEAANKYLMQNIHDTELRIIAVENSLVDKHYILAEKLCKEALNKSTRRYFNKPVIWLYYLEKLYTQTGNKAKLIEVVHSILFHGDISYYNKLKELYQHQGIWEQKREQLLHDLLKALEVNKWLKNN